MNAPTEDRWNQLWMRAGASKAPAEWYSRLARLYTEPDRSYHSFRHIADCLMEFDGAKSLAQDPVAVELAIWLHDAIYSSRKSDNEQRSAEFAQQCLTEANASAELAAKVSKLILATQSHESDGEPDTALLVDIDFAILGQSESRFLEYEDQVRQEYVWVPLDSFTARRGELLRSLLNRPKIYTTELFFKRYEEQARHNLRESLTRARLHR